MAKPDKVSPDDLINRSAQFWASEASRAVELVRIPNEELFALLAARTSDPQEAFGTPADRFGTRFDPGALPRGPSFFEVGRRVFQRQALALHRFLCAPGNEDAELRQRIKDVLVTKDVSAVAVIAGGLVAVFGMGAAAAAVVAALLVKIVIAPSVDALCDVWTEKINAAISGASGAEQ